MSSYEQKKFTSILQSLKKERMLEFYELRHDLDETMALHPSEQKMIECLIDKDARSKVTRALPIRYEH